MIHIWLQKEWVWERNILSLITTLISKDVWFKDNILITFTDLKWCFILPLKNVHHLKLEKSNPRRRWHLMETVRTAETNMSAKFQCMELRETPSLLSPPHSFLQVRGGAWFWEVLYSCRGEREAHLHLPVWSSPSSTQRVPERRHLWGVKRGTHLLVRTPWKCYCCYMQSLIQYLCSSGSSVCVCVWQKPTSISRQSPHLLQP